MARLIETSVWIDFVRANTPVARKLAIEPWILDPDACLCEPVAFEVLRHATAAERARIGDQFATLPLVRTPVGLWNEATRLGQRCRDQGLSPGSLDLLIAAIALHHDAELISFDTDYAAITRVAPLRLHLLTR